MARKIIFFLFIIVSLSCSGLQVKTEESLRAIAEKYWNYKMNGDFKKTYKMEYKEVLPTYDVYKELIGGFTKFEKKSIKFGDIRIYGDEGIVDIEINFRMPGITKVTKDIYSDIWIYKDGKWWHKFTR